MIILTEYQKEFILNNFFKNEKYAGWKTIATTLLEKGECIVAGEGCIWRGGIGNFIKTEHAKGEFFCTRYKFDLANFLSSEWYKEISGEYCQILRDKREALYVEWAEICNLNALAQKA